MLRSLFLSSIVLFMSSSVSAAQFSGIGYINKIVAIPAKTNADYILVDNFTLAGSCPLSHGMVVVRFKSAEEDHRAYSLAMAAKMANKRIKLAVDDSVKNSSGYCYVISLELNE
ncbi:hypothetical protein [Shewanella sp. YLB-07]|uniref:hypothetical protein n=1 Tax=Shewanella sp. YLB-07 TaxID=2601268 RepID=UPI00128C4F89|nr:hypothetical protein [Shewanella sp. YLB-07]MPY24343.1 hypothetical protein [Shewanella sp. YLB-07]